MILSTTLILLQEHEACEERYPVLVSALGEGWADTAPIPLLRILESNGIDDALWALRAVPPDQEADRDQIARIFACDCAERTFPIWVKHYPNDTRPQQAVAVARRFAAGDATAEELAAPMDAAWDAAMDAAWDAASAVASAAARGAARAAAWDAASAVASAAASAAERAWQRETFRAALTAGAEVVKVPLFNNGNPIFPQSDGSTQQFCVDILWGWRKTVLPSGHVTIHRIDNHILDKLLKDQNPHSEVWEPWNDPAPPVDEPLWELVQEHHVTPR